MSEPMVVGSMSMVEVKGIINPKLIPDVTVTVAEGDATSHSQGSPNLSELETFMETSSPQSASTPAEEVPFLRESQQVPSDSDDNFIKPGAAPPRPDPNKIFLHQDLPGLERPYQDLTDSQKRTFAVNDIMEILRRS